LPIQKIFSVKATIVHGFLAISLMPKLTNSVERDNNPYPVKVGTRVRASIKLVNLVPMKRTIEVIT
jgi:acyl dehydratase